MGGLGGGVAQPWISNNRPANKIGNRHFPVRVRRGCCGSTDAFSANLSKAADSSCFIPMHYPLILSGILARPRTGSAVSDKRHKGM